MAAENGSSPAAPPSVPEIGTRKLGPRVSPRQMEILLEFLNQHPYLASTSKEKSREVEPWERERLWEEAANKLNAKGPAVKSRSSWRKFWSSRSSQIKRTVARIAKMREESRQPPRPPPLPPPPRPPTDQILLLLKQDGTPAINTQGRILLPRPGPAPQHQVLLHMGAPGEPPTMFMATADCPPPRAVHKEVTTALAGVPAETPGPSTGPTMRPPKRRGRPRKHAIVEGVSQAAIRKRAQRASMTQGGMPLQAQSLLNGVLVEQSLPSQQQQQPEPPRPAPPPPPPPPLQQQQQQHVLANGGPPPDPDSIPVLEPITAEEHFHAEMLHQTIRQTALLQDLLSAQQRIAQAAERQAQAAENQSHALSQLVLFLVENHHSNRNPGNASCSGDESCPETALPLSITPEIVQGNDSASPT
ncbi:uncharacterized protein LOC144104954 isoform X2 [Amblyomma americanum]